MHIFIRLLLILGLLLAFNCYAWSSKSGPIYAGEKIQIHSKILDEPRSLLIKLPTDYDIDSEKRYPVLFTLDGDNHFAHVTGTVDWLSNHANRIPRLIVVAISNTNRSRDMTPHYNKGGANQFMAFLETELLPLIDKNYRTEPFRILVGHSMAGHLTLNSFLQKPQLFNAYIATSPYFTMDRGETKLTEQLSAYLQKDQSKYHFIYTSIGDEKYLLPRYEKLIKGLEVSKDKSLQWRSSVYSDEEHMSTPARTLNPALQFIFAQQRLAPTSEVAKQGFDAIRDYFKGISDDVYGYQVTPAASMNRLGYHKVYFEDDLAGAIRVFETNVEWFPEMALSNDALAWAYALDKQYKKAIPLVDKAIVLTPEGHSDMQYYQNRKRRIERAMHRAQQQ